MGSGIARLVVEKHGLHLVGAYCRRRDRAGIDIGRAIGLHWDLGMSLRTDLAGIVADTRPHIAIQATCSRLTDAIEEITTLVRQGVHVISIAEEMTYPTSAAPQLAESMHRLAVGNGVAVLGTGINPGFVLDLLVIALTGVCSHIASVTATRVNDLSPYGATVLTSQGVGLTPEAFGRGLEDGTVVGHVGFPQSLHMIADAVGWNIGRIEEKRAPIIAQVRRETPLVIVEPGHVAGCLHTATAYWRDTPIITLVHPQQVQPQLEGIETGDTIEICGTPHIRLASSPEIPGGQATIALAVNMIPHVLNATPGLHTMRDLPVPAAQLGDIRKTIHGELHG
jgi:4-hydroxy-tetrahydrodipicolinate reductase